MLAYHSPLYLLQVTIFIDLERLACQILLVTLYKGPSGEVKVRILCKSEIVILYDKLLLLFPTDIFLL